MRTLMVVVTRFLSFCALLGIVIFTITFSSKAVSESTTLSQEDRYAPIRFGIPETIGGYLVIAVLTEDNSACMKPGEKRLILQSPQPTIKDGPRIFPKKQIEQELQALNLAEYAQGEWEIVGPGVNREQLVSQLEQSYRFFKAHGCPNLELPKITSPGLALPANDNGGCSLISGSELTGGEFKCDPPSPGFAIIQNLGPDTYPDNNGQSVVLIAPTVGNNQTWKWQCSFWWSDGNCGGYSAFLNNGMTDKGYWFQVGLYFTNRNDPLNPLLRGNIPPIPPGCVTLNDPGNPFSPEGIGLVVYAGAKVENNNTVTPPQAHPLCVPYTSGHHYYTTIAYTSGTWWTCAADMQDTTTYKCIEHPDATATGSTHLINNRRGTNVFAENWNKHPTWTQGFPYQWVAYGAKIYVDGKPNLWPNESKWTVHSCKYEIWYKNWPPNEAIDNSSGLANDGVAYFNTTSLPLYCE